MSIDAGDEHDLERDAAGDDPPERLDPIPEHLDVREERSVLGAKTGEIIVRCKLCLETAPVEEWRSLTHKTDCKHPIESYRDGERELVVQSWGRRKRGCRRRRRWSGRMRRREPPRMRGCPAAYSGRSSRRSWGRSDERPSGSSARRRRGRTRVLGLWCGLLLGIGGRGLLCRGDGSVPYGRTGMSNVHMAYTTLAVQCSPGSAPGVVRGVDAAPRRRRDRRPPADRRMARVNSPLRDAEAEGSTHVPRSGIPNVEIRVSTAVAREGRSGRHCPAAALRSVQGGNQQFSDLER